MIVGHPRLTALFGHIARRTRAQVALWLSLLCLTGALALTPSARMARPISGGGPRLQFAHGSVRWLAADAATTTYAVTCTDVGGAGTFQPKAIRFYWNGIGTGADANSTSLDLHHGIGFATGTAARRCVSGYSQDAAAAALCGSGCHDAAVAATIDGAAAYTGLLDLSSLDAGGFTLVVDDQVPVNLSVHWEAWGGDLSVATVGSIAEPASTGSVNYTVTGFTSDGGQQVVMFAGCQSTAVVPAAVADDNGICIGFASAAAVGTSTSSRTSARR